MRNQICMNCKKVYLATGGCCGELEDFDPCIHGQRLVGLSNAWIDVWGLWKDHPLMEEVIDEAYRNGSYGASAMLNRFVEKLIEGKEK